MAQDHPVVAPPKTLVRPLVGAIAVVSCLSLLSALGQYLGHGYLRGLVPLFDMGAENNVPAWFASATLLLCAGLLVVVARVSKMQGRPFAFQWCLLALPFFYLSMAEVTATHVVLSSLLRSESGLFGPALLALVVLVAALAFLFRGFVAHLPGSMRLRGVLAATIYIGFGTASRWAGEYVIQKHGLGDLGSSLLATVEKSVQLVGLALLVFALLSYIRDLWRIPGQPSAQNRASGGATPR